MEWKTREISPKRAGEAGEEEKQGGKENTSHAQKGSEASKFIYEKEKKMYFETRSKAAPTEGNPS